MHVKFDAFVQIFDESFNINVVFVPLLIVVSYVLPSTVEVCPPLSDTHALHTRLELRNICVTYFKLSWVTCATHVSRVGSELSRF
jgi:hypothetical protein